MSEFSRPFALDTIGDSPRAVSIVATPEECTALAVRFECSEAAATLCPGEVAWSADDGYSTARASNGGTYTLPVIAGMTWNVRAVAETRNSYWITRTAVMESAPGVTVQNLVLSGPKLKPAPVSVMFDASQDELVELADGTRIFIPGGALPATGMVSLHITPLAAVPSHRLGEVFGLGYEFEAFTGNGQPITHDFNQDVAISFRYDPTGSCEKSLDA